MEIEVKIDAFLEGEPGHIEVSSDAEREDHVWISIVGIAALVHVEDLIDAAIRCRRDRRPPI